MVLMSLLLNKFARPPYCCYCLNEIKNYEVGVVTNGIISRSNFAKIDQIVQKLEVKANILTDNMANSEVFRDPSDLLIPYILYFF